MNGSKVKDILKLTLKYTKLHNQFTQPKKLTKNKKNTPDRMELKKFNSIMKKMTIHKEIK